ncbi:hypothetical protein OSB04_031345 [Centaurea solstitialis]|uniref:CCHC-type domain-containing protein n=1 Tax=Centaurea solstitialis TaxID=347529 RepID=A0AA38VU81_9ASTR|nr:hypothetical protein OSB04_031345 [Centaurea solstitialis]
MLKVTQEEGLGRGRVTQEEGSGRGRGRYAGGSYQGRGRRRFSPSKATVECYWCHKLGHFQLECPEWGKRAKFAEMDEEKELLLMVYLEHQGTTMEEVWFFDFGCSNHMSGNKDWFIEVDGSFRHTIKLGNDSRINVTGIGSIRMKGNGIIQEKGLTILIKDNKFKVFESRRWLIMQSEMSGNRMFYFKAALAIKTLKCYQTQVEDEATLWHSRFGHLHYTGLRTLACNGMVEGMSIVKTPQKMCVHCLIGKQQREFIPKKSTWRATKKLQLIHSDICGPITPTSNSEKDEKRHKLDEKSRVHVFLGVSKESKAYRFVDPVNRNIIFDESEGWKWEETKKEKTTDVLEWPNSSDLDDDEGDGIKDSDNSMASRSSSETSGNNSPLNISSNTTPNSPNERVLRTPSERVRRAPTRLNDYVSGDVISEQEEDATIMVHLEDPLTYEGATKDERWREAMKKEIESIIKNNTWELVSLQQGCKAVATKGEIEKHKARLVAKGYSQQFGIDYTEFFAPFACLDTIRAILATAAQENWEVFQMDVKSAFLQGKLEETVFVQQPVGFKVKGEEEKVYKLHKALYGLKQAPRAWYNRIESYFIKERDAPVSIHSLPKKRREVRNNTRACEEFKYSMMAEFDMLDLRKMRHFLGMRVLQHKKGIFICQRRYAKQVLRRFGMKKNNLVGNPIVPGKKIFGEKEGTRVDATRIMRYIQGTAELGIQGTAELGILYKQEENSGMIAYSDSNFAGDLDDRKSTSGLVFILAGGVVSWSSKKQPVVTLSTTETEYIAAALCAC